MANLTLAGVNTPYINGVTLKRVMATAVKKNIFQDIFTKPDEAVTERFSTDTDAAQIQVIRVKPQADDDAREIGSNVNGEYFNSKDAHLSNTEAYGINILTTIDRNVDIPTTMQDMISVDMAQAELENLSGRVSRNINAATIAAQLVRNCNDIAATTVPDNWIKLGATPKYLDAIIDALAKLDEGNPLQDIDAYPDGNRALFIRPAAKAALLKSGQLIVGGSNSAQAIIRGGGLDEDTKPQISTTGFVGTVGNTPVYVVSPVVFALAEKYAGLSVGGFVGVEMMAVSAIGTGRALAFNSAIKTIDSPAGQGIRLQPKYRFGVDCWDALSIVPIVSSTFTNPATKAAQLKLLAPGSRTSA